MIIPFQLFLLIFLAIIGFVELNRGLLVRTHRADSLSIEDDFFKYKTILDHNDRVRLEWNVNKTSRVVRFKLILVDLRLPLFVGFGASDHGEFENADFVVFEIKWKNASIPYLDCYTNKKGILKADDSMTKSNYILNSVELPLGKIELQFSRKFDTCDLRDYRIEPGTVHLLHFIESDFVKYKSLKGLVGKNYRPEIDANRKDMKQAQIIKSTYFDRSVAYFDASKHKKFQIINKNVRIPAQETVYWCRVAKLDDVFKRKHHIIAYESVISERSRGVAHHMELFHCRFDPPSEMTNYDGPCKSEEKPPGLTQCRRVIAAWAMGASRFVYPEDVGGVVGGPDYSLYLVLEIHFDNPKLRSDIIDNSGIRIFYQGGEDELLRKYDAGIMEVGLEYNAKNSIPPQISVFHLHGHCLAECTGVALKKPITIFASQLHTHLTGRRVWTSLVRKGEVVELINADNHFDQMFQEIRLLENPVEVQPGDAIVNTCVYETLSRVNMTLGGYGITDEMCVNYMHYYPASDLELCKSSISDSNLNDFFEKMRYFDRSQTSRQKSIGENFNSIRWTPLTSAMLSRLYDTAPISFSCNRSEGTRFESIYSTNEYKRLNEAFLPTRARGLTTRLARIDPSLRENCAKDASPDYGNDYDDDDEYEDKISLNKDDL